MRISLGVAAASCALFLSGCQSVPLTTNTTETQTVPGAALQGRVHGGNNPITGASVYLYAVGTGGYGGASVSLLTNPVATNSSGNFTITGDYSCPANAQVYIYAKGGNPGLASGTNNTAAGLLAGLGSCSTLLSEGSSFPFIWVNEVSTVATAYALAGYAKDATDISSSGSTLALAGVANAFAAIPNLETLSTGVALATTPAANGGNGTVPQTEINTLANILAACINTTGSTATGQPCNTLFTNALSGGTTGTQPTDTATAAINIAHNPWANISALYGLQTASSPFQTDLSAAPNDWTIAITYEGPIGGGLESPLNLAIDGAGNVWVDSDVGGAFKVSEFTPGGSLLSGSSGYTGGGLNYPDGIAIDSTGNVWVANWGNDTLTELKSNGSAGSGSPFSGGGLSEPTILAIDASGEVWVTNELTGNISEFNSSGGAVSGSGGISGGGLEGAWDLAVDVSGNVWIASYDNNGLSEYNPTNGWVSASGYTGGGLDGPVSVAIDGSGNVWATNEGDDSLSEFTSGGTPISPADTGYTSDGLIDAAAIAVDGSGNIWVTNGEYANTSACEFNSSGTAVSGSICYNEGSSVTAGYIAIDGSGNVWLGTGWLVELVGAASPVVTPIVANLKSPYGSHAVNKP